MIKNIVLAVAVVSFAFCSACIFSNNKPTQSVQNTNTATPKPAEETAKTVENKDTKQTEKPKTESGGDKSACLKASKEGKRLIADQTFVFDYEPFRKSCFVTFGSKTEMMDEKDVPRGSTFHIFKDGEIVYDFEDAFDGMPACWVEGVGFEDLNGDGKTEVIIAGSCLAAKDSYPMNAIYLNIRDDFRTYQSSNQHLENLKTVGEIKEYVKKNKDKFFDSK